MLTVNALRAVINYFYVLVAEVTERLGLHAIRNRNWFNQATCATSGDGLYEGLEWLANILKNK